MTQVFHERPQCGSEQFPFIVISFQTAYRHLAVSLSIFQQTFYYADWKVNQLIKQCAACSKQLVQHTGRKSTIFLLPSPRLRNISESAKQTKQSLAHTTLVFLRQNFFCISRAVNTLGRMDERTQGNHYCYNVVKHHSTDILPNSRGLIES